ncbi:hypothetical protein [Peptoniphilus sp.]|uniref:hypothetical protein n=1 Tax=Peptoniphilus sp. TaxID=1971214 RepID=UPI002A7F55FC|nr:hypothetical protein [Peptoniphilus sp.]MDY3903077.1 hypothetical protein [Peptoniphilus sp.]
MKKSISFILVFVITLINFSYAFTTESNETSMDTHKEEILNDVYEQLKLQGVEDQFDKWVKEDVERILENDNSGNQKLLKSQRSSSKYAPNGAAVSYKNKYANTVHIYLNRRQSIDLRNGRKDGLAAVAGALSVPIGVIFTSVGGFIGLASSLYSLESWNISKIVNNGGCIVSVTAETTPADPDGVRTFGYYIEWNNFYNINVSGAYDYVIK